MYFLLLAFFLLLYPILLQIGTPVALVQFVICLLGVIILSKNTKVTARKKRTIVFLLFLLSFIDKVNDLMADFDFVAGVGPIIYTVIIAITFSRLTQNETCRLIKYLYIFSALSVMLGVGANLAVGNTLYRTFDREYSFALLLFWVLNMWYGKKKILFTVLVFFVNVFLFKARTMILSMAFIMFCYYYLDRISLRMRYIIFLGIFASGIALVAAGMVIEFYEGTGNTEFSNHGIIWGVAVEQVFNSKSIINLLFGYPTTSNSLSSVFSSISMLYNDNAYIANAENMLERGHFHCSLVYYLYNTGIVGVALLFYIIYKALKIKRWNNESFALWGAIFYVAVFNGMSLTGIYIISTIFMLSILLDFPAKNSYNIKLL